MARFTPLKKPGNGPTAGSSNAQKSFVDMLLTGLTGALYSPTSVTVECAGAAH